MLINFRVHSNQQNETGGSYKDDEKEAYLLWGIDLSDENEYDQNRKHREDHKCIDPPLGDPLTFFKKGDWSGFGFVHVFGM